MAVPIEHSHGLTEDGKTANLKTATALGKIAGDGTGLRTAINLSSFAT
ncbi:MAG: hypothetical protein JSS49_16860 [Planctomycetes bacterium]|nr:hypothetical protein [Planctomycetota bacterium]